MYTVLFCVFYLYFLFSPSVLCATSFIKVVRLTLTRQFCKKKYYIAVDTRTLLYHISE